MIYSNQSCKQTNKLNCCLHDGDDAIVIVVVVVVVVVAAVRILFHKLLFTFFFKKNCCYSQTMRIIKITIIMSNE